MTTENAARKIDITLTHWIGGAQKIQVDAYIEMDEGYDYFNGDEEVCIQRIESDGDSSLPFYLLAEEMEDIFFRLEAEADKALQGCTYPDPLTNPRPMTDQLKIFKVTVSNRAHWAEYLTQATTRDKAADKVLEYMSNVGAADEEYGGQFDSSGNATVDDVWLRDDFCYGVDSIEEGKHHSEERYPMDPYLVQSGGNG